MTKNFGCRTSSILSSKGDFFSKAFSSPSLLVVFYYRVTTKADQLSWQTNYDKAARHSAQINRTLAKWHANKKMKISIAAHKLRQINAPFCTN